MLLRARVLSIVVAISLVASSSGFARVLWACGMSGRVGPTCCCAPEKPAPRRPGAAIRRADCCQATTIRAHERVASERTAAPEVPISALYVLLSLPAPPHLEDALASREPARARGPPRAGPPLYIENCTLLS